MVLLPLNWNPPGGLLGLSVRFFMSVGWQTSMDPSRKQGFHFFQELLLRNGTMVSIRFFGSFQTQPERWLRQLPRRHECGLLHPGREPSVGQFVWGVLEGVQRENPRVLGISWYTVGEVL